MSHIFEDERLLENLFERAKMDSEWPLIRGYLGKRPEIAGWRNKKWGETLSHWAALGNLPALIELLAANPEQDLKDNAGRTPLAWCIEKAYFLETDPPAQMGKAKVQQELAKLESCAFHLMNSGADILLRLGSEQDGYTLLELVCKAGLLSLLEHACRIGSRPGQREMLGVLEGLWIDSGAFAKAMDLAGIGSGTELFGQSALLCAAELYILGRIDKKRLRECSHKLGSLDAAETEDCSLADVCSRHAKGPQMQGEIESLLS